MSRIKIEGYTIISQVEPSQWSSKSQHLDGVGSLLNATVKEYESSQTQLVEKLSKVWIQRPFVRCNTVKSMLPCAS